MPTTTTEKMLMTPELAPLAENPETLTEEELEALEDAEDLAIAKERCATMDRSQLIPAGTARSTKQRTAA